MSPHSRIRVLVILRDGILDGSHHLRYRVSRSVIWLVTSLVAGVAGLLYVTTGVHGGHVLLGMLLILLYATQAHTYAVHSAVSTDTIHGLLGIILY